MYPDVAFSKSLLKRIFIGRAPEGGTCSCMATLWWAMAAAGWLLPGLVKAAEQGRIAAQSDQAQKRRAETQRRQRSAKAVWKDSDLPAWLDKEFYLRQIQPRLSDMIDSKRCWWARYDSNLGPTDYERGKWTTADISHLLLSASDVAQRILA
jgi:hypothetical protein